MKRAFFLLTLVGLFTLNLQAQTTTGTWTLFGDANQPPTYLTAIQQPINSDDTSVFSANRGVVPVKFSLSSGRGPLGISSVCTDCGVGQTWSTLTYGGVKFVPTSTLTLGDLTTLQATYTMNGTCGGGSPRFAINYGTNQNIAISLGPPPSFIGTCDSVSTFGSGYNVISGPNDPRFDSSQLIPGTQMNTLTNLLGTSWATTPINYIIFVVDGGWLGSQVLTVSSFTINDNTFSAEPVPLAPTCQLPDATIQVFKSGDSTPIPIDEGAYLFPADNGSSFRISNCQYVYNLGTKALVNNLGAGEYTVQAIIGGHPTDKAATFELK